MLQVFDLSVAKVDLVFHMLQWDSPVAAICCSCWVMSGGVGPLLGRRRAGTDVQAREAEGARAVLVWGQVARAMF